jgi:hypothetical protein
MMSSLDDLRIGDDCPLTVAVNRAAPIGDDYGSVQEHIDLLADTAHPVTALFVGQPHTASGFLYLW